jgi:hypothetical protein
MQSLQDARKPTAGCHSPAARHADMEAGSLAEMPVLSERSLGAAGTDDQADRGALGHAVQVGASGRGALKARNCQLYVAIGAP